jgi:uncharacterized membrane protein YphA (DoxX/SURF4 family)
MSQRLEKLAIPALRWTLGLVLILESYRFAVSTFAQHFLGKIGLPPWVAPVLGGAEIAASILFLIPAASLVGSFALLFIFLIAAIIHFLHGAFDVSGLVVYAAAVVVCMTHRSAEAKETAHVG